MSDSQRVIPVRLVDLCAGLGGFKYGTRLAAERSAGTLSFECLMASELDEELRRIYVRNHGDSLGFRDTYRKLYPPEACEGEGLDDLYDEKGDLQKVHGPIENYLDGSRLRKWNSGPRVGQTIVPDHDLLCAGFPCQPFSKSGYQIGFDDSLPGRGTVWELIWVILNQLQPDYVLLENVGNFERHDSGRTWRRVRGDLSQRYDVVATAHVSSGDGTGLLSPHHLGFPHHRERFFVCAQHKRKGGFHTDPLLRLRQPRNGPASRGHREDELARTALLEIIEDGQSKADQSELEAANLSRAQVSCVEHWQELLSIINNLPFELQTVVLPMPSFPIWGFELDPWHHYPYETSPWECSDDDLRAYRKATRDRAKSLRLPPPQSGANLETFKESSRPNKWREAWPSYTRRDEWPRWKVRFVEQNRDWAAQLLHALAGDGRLKWYRSWLDGLARLAPSHQKLEWNCQGERLELLTHILQFRPSGLRVKRFRHVPALVASTATQIPVVPVPHSNGTPKARFLLTSEGCQIQGLPPDWQLPESRSIAFKALGNAVHAEMIAAILTEWLGGVDSPNGRTNQMRLSARARMPCPQAVEDVSPEHPTARGEKDDAISKRSHQ